MAERRLFNFSLLCADSAVYLCVRSMRSYDCNVQSVCHNTSIDWEDYKTSGSFIHSYNLNFTLWKCKRKTGAELHKVYNVKAGQCNLLMLCWPVNRKASSECLVYIDFVLVKCTCTVISTISSVSLRKYNTD